MVGPGRFPPLQRVGVEMLACCDPLGLGLHMTHWSMRSLAQVAIERGLAPNIAHSTVSERRQLLLPVNDNYFCRFRPRPSPRPTAPIFTTNLG